MDDRDDPISSPVPTDEEIDLEQGAEDEDPDDKEAEDDE